MVLKEEPATKFVIAGEGAEKRNLEREAKNLKVSPSVEFLGRVPHKKMPGLLSQADLYVSTSLSDGTSVSLLEAMAAGSFPVVTDIVSNREWVVDGENGFLVRTDSVDLLAQRIVDAIRNGSLLEKARQRNVEIVQTRAYWKENIGRVIELYRNGL